MSLHVLDNGICQTCQPTDHYLVDGMCEGCSDAEPLGEDEQALLHALNELDGQTSGVRAAWSEELHPRGPGGRFRSNVDRLKEAITKHRAGQLAGDAHPFDGFNREQLRRVAKARGIELTRGESKDSISAKLLEHLVPAEPTGKATTGKVAPSKPATKQAALDAAPVRLGPHGFFERGPAGEVGDPGALDFYRGHGYIEINSYLREGRAHSAEGPPDRVVNEIDHIMEHSALTKDILVHRGVGDLAMFGPAGRSHKSLVGLAFRDNAYASATADKNVANEFFGAENYRGHGAILDITVPKGTKAVQLSSLGPKPKHHWEFPRPVDQEAEVLLQRGLTYRVIGDRIVNGIRHLEVEVIAP